MGNLITAHLSAIVISSVNNTTTAVPTTLIYAPIKVSKSKCFVILIILPKSRKDAMLDLNKKFSSRRVLLSECLPCVAPQA